MLKVSDENRSSVDEKPPNLVNVNLLAVMETSDGGMIFLCDNLILSVWHLVALVTSNHTL